MNATVSVRNAKAHWSRLLRRAHAGEEIVITQAGKPYARLVPLGQPAKRKLGFINRTVDDSFFEPLPEEELDSWA